MYICLQTRGYLICARRGLPLPRAEYGGLRSRRIRQPSSARAQLSGFLGPIASCCSTTSLPGRLRTYSSQNEKKQRRVEDTENIVIDDLAATLEAHRAANRAKVVRKVVQEANVLDFKRPSIEYTSPDTGTKPREDASSDSKVPVRNQSEPLEEIRNEKVASPQIDYKSLPYGTPRDGGLYWPTHSIQYSNIHGEPKSYGDKVLEYEGFDVSAVSEWIPNLGEKWDDPWYQKTVYDGGSGLERLSSEINAFQDYMKLTPEEEKASKLVIADVKAITREKLPSKPVTVIGSYATGLATPTSDIDFSISLPEVEKDLLARGPSSTRPEARKACNRALYKLKESFSLSAYFDDVEHIHARVPLLKATHTETNLRVQIQALASYLPQQEYTAAYLSEFPTLRPLYVLLRHALEIRNLATVFEGGLGSYSILMMIVAALKDAGPKYPRHDLGSHLLHVLEFYATADLYKNAYSVDPFEAFSKHDHRQLSKPYLLYLRDPTNPLNDLGSKAYAIKHVQAVFRATHQILLARVHRWDRYSDEDRQNILRVRPAARNHSVQARMKIQHPVRWILGGFLGHLLRAEYRRFEKRRERVEDVARERAGDLKRIEAGEVGVRKVVSWERLVERVKTEEMRVV